MPYVITTTRPIEPDEHGLPYCGACSHYHEGACLCPDCGRPTPCSTHGVDGSVSTPAPDVSRRAVATFGDVRTAIYGLGVLPTKPYHTFNYWRRMVRELPDSGGSVGPLPDGTMIEVEHVRWDAINPDMDGGPMGPEDAEIELDAFNAGRR